MVELEALNVLIQSDGLRVLGSDEPHYTASRIFPKLLAQRPLFGLYHTASSVCSIATVAAGVVVITHDHPRPPQSRVSQIADLLGQWLERERATDLPARDTLLQNNWPRMSHVDSPRCSTVSMPALTCSVLASAALSPDTRGTPWLRARLHVPRSHRGNAMHHQDIRDLPPDLWTWEPPSDIEVGEAVR